MILTIKTDQPDAVIGLYEGSKSIAIIEWPAHRQLAETIHTKIEALLQEQDITWHDLTGIAVYQGPGSFTGLRIGISIANALAYGLQIPVAGAVGDAWPHAAIQAVQDGTTQGPVMPEYGAPVHITQPRK